MRTSNILFKLTAQAVGAQVELLDFAQVSQLLRYGACVIITPTQQQFRQLVLSLNGKLIVGHDQAPSDSGMATTYRQHEEYV